METSLEVFSIFRASRGIQAKKPEIDGERLTWKVKYAPHAGKVKTRSIKNITKKLT